MADKNYISKVHLPDGKDYELKDLEARDLIETLSHIGLSFVRSKDAATTPLGVKWLDGSTVITGTLAPSKDIKNIYLVPDNIDSGSLDESKYIEYVCVIVSGAGTEADPYVFAWEAIGSTDARLDNLGEMAKADTASAAGVVFNGTLPVVQSTGVFTAHGTVSKPAVDEEKTYAVFAAGSLPTKAADTFTQGTLPSYTEGAFDAGELPSFTEGEFKAGSLPSFTEGAFNAGTLPSKEVDTWDPGTLPTKAADTFSAGTLPSKAADTFNAGALPSKAKDTFVKPVLTAEVAAGTETLVIDFSQGSFTEGAFDAGSLPSYTEGAFSAGTLPSFKEGAFTQGTLPSFEEGDFNAGSLPSKAADTWNAGTLPSKEADTWNAGALPSKAADSFGAGTLPTFKEGAFSAGALPTLKNKTTEEAVSDVLINLDAELHEAPVFTGTAGEAITVNTAGTDAISTSGNITVNPDPKE